MGEVRCATNGARWASVVLAVIALASVDAAPRARAQTEGPSRRVTLRFTPTARAQLAVWVESADGSRFRTVRLTHSVADLGIGNRPGATQMNSGFRWPYGRREGVLPVWAHRRIEAGGEPFPRVIFNGRVSEGNASSAGSSGEPRNTPDDDFCLSFQRDLSGRDALDAMTCASPFMSNKGRYMTEADVEDAYAEPWEDAGGSGRMRAMPLTSLYPPRRNLTMCTGLSCGDHEDVARFAADAREAMPSIDAVTMATPAADREQRIPFEVPADWPDGEYVAYVEVHVEGDWNDVHDGEAYPTPTLPTGMWDYWAINYGYAYRGQPSIVYRVPFRLEPAGGEWVTDDPAGYAALHGEDGELREIDETITDAPASAPGSGADRLRLGQSGPRLSVLVAPWDVCEQPDPPAMCGWECEPGDGSCGSVELICGPERTCVGRCDVSMQPGAVMGFSAGAHPEEKESHHWGRLRFGVPESPRGVSRYEVRVGTEPITDLASFTRALPAREPSIESVELTVPVDGAAGDVVELDFGGLNPQTRYWIGIRAIDECNAPGPLAVAELTTTEIHFTTVSPCFVATAAYGSALEPRIGALRRLRDRHLRTNAPGRALVRAYETVGPHAADAIRQHAPLRALARVALAPWVAFAERLQR